MVLLSDIDDFDPSHSEEEAWHSVLDSSDDAYKTEEDKKAIKAKQKVDKWQICHDNVFDWCEAHAKHWPWLRYVRREQLATVLRDMKKGKVLQKLTIERYPAAVQCFCEELACDKFEEILNIFRETTKYYAH